MIELNQIEPNRWPFKNFKIYRIVEHVSRYVSNRSQSVRYLVINVVAWGLGDVTEVYPDMVFRIKATTAHCNGCMNLRKF